MTIAAYVLFDPNTNSYYFGSSGDVDKRLAQHFSDLRAGRHHCAPLQVLWDKYGALETITYPCATREEAYESESALIAANQDSSNLLNIWLHVKGGDNLTRNPRREEIIERRRDTQLQLYQQMGAEVRREKWGRAGTENPMFGRRHTAEAKRRMAVVNSTHEVAERLSSYKSTEKYRRSMSEAASRRIGEKITFFGRTHTEATKERIRQGRIGKIPGNAQRVHVNGIEYSSVREACDRVGISYPTMIKRLKSDDPNYSFVS